MLINYYYYIFYIITGPALDDAVSKKEGVDREVAEQERKLSELNNQFEKLIIGSELGNKTQHQHLKQ